MSSMRAPTECPVLSDRVTAVPVGDCTGFSVLRILGPDGLGHLVPVMVHVAPSNCLGRD